MIQHSDKENRSSILERLAQESCTHFSGICRYCECLARSRFPSQFAVIDADSLSGRAGRNDRPFSFPLQLIRP